MAHMLQPRHRDPHRLFPADPQVRSIAADLYALVAQAPIISPHGHVPAAWLSTDAAFRDPVDLFVTHDHYVTRQLHSAGVDPAALAAVAETAGFYRGSGFIDDTRAFLSIPARHDTARRADAAFLARLVAEGRIALPMAERIIADLVGDLPRQVFKL